jgi:sugar/nucleoside kinase (ribokinase family)
MTHIPAIPVTGPINAVGANDSVLAVVTVALCAGATLDEAVQAGSLAAAATMRSGVTGGVAPDQIVALWRAYHKYS